MPNIVVELIKGRTVAQRRAFVEQVTAITCECLNTTAEHVTVRFVDIEPDQYAANGKLYSEK